MRFMMMYTPGKDRAGVPPSKEHVAEMAKFADDATKAGELLVHGGLLPIAKGGRVRHAGGKLSVTDGPFTESKELIAGFAIVQLKSREDAIESAKRFLKVAGEGECEIRQIMDAPPDVAA
jgi:hypothetical protein